MPQWLDQLNASNAQTAQFFNFAQNAFNSMHARDMQERQFEFNIAAKGAELAERQRMNDYRIEDIKIRNAMAQQAHQVDMQLLPLRFQEAQMALEARRADLVSSKLQSINAQFQAATAPYNPIIGAEFARTQDPNILRSFLDLKAKSIADVQSGKPFDPNWFRGEVQKIIRDSSELPPTATSNMDWSPETSYLLGQVDPAVRSQYDQRNPVRQRNRIGAIASLITGSEKDFQETLRVFGNQFSQEEMPDIVQTREAYRSYGVLIDQKQNALEDLVNKIGRDDTDPKLDAVIEEEKNQLIRLLKLRQKLLNDAIGGDFNLSDLEEGVDTGSKAPIDARSQELFEKAKNLLQKVSDGKLKQLSPEAGPIEIQTRKASSNAAAKKISDDLKYNPSGRPEDSVDLLEGFEPSYSDVNNNEKSRGLVGNLLGTAKYNIGDFTEASRIIRKNAEKYDTDQLYAAVSNILRTKNFDAVKDTGIVYFDRPAPNSDEANYGVTFDSELGMFNRQATFQATGNRGGSTERFKTIDDVDDYINEDGISEAEKRARIIRIYTGMTFSLLEKASRDPEFFNQK